MSRLRSPDLTWTVTMGDGYSSYTYQLRNAMAPALMPMKDANAVYSAVQQFGSGMARSLAADKETYEAFGGTIDKTGVVLYPHELRTPVAIYNWELGYQ